MEEKMDTYQQGLNQQGIDRAEGAFSAAVAFRATEYEVIGDEFCGRLKKLPELDWCGVTLASFWTVPRWAVSASPSFKNMI
jgi:hypothetical protein